MDGRFYDGNNPYRTTLIVENKLGIHARPAMMVAEAAGNFDGKVLYIKNGIPIDAKSVMQILTTQSIKGSKITFEIYPTNPIEKNGDVSVIEKLVGSLERAVSHDDD